MRPGSELLVRLLEKYERSAAFGQPGPWRQDVIVRLDAREFPAAFEPEGREALADLRAGAEDLLRAGAARIVRHRGYADGLPREARLGPGEVERAYALAAGFEFVPLAEALRDLATLVESLRAAPAPEWMAAYLDRVASGIARADVSALGLQRERFKRERGDVRDALTAAVALAPGASGWERVISERIFGQSKRLAAVRSLVLEILLRADPRWDGVSRDDAGDVLEAYGVRRKAGLIRCAGRGTMEVAGYAYELEHFAPSAHLPEAWADAWVEAIVRGTAACITTIENETPFLAYVEEAKGPGGLGERGELVIYTAGFPSPSLLDALSAARIRKPALDFRHWGDADVGGLRIWWLIRSRLGCPVALYRTRAEWLEATIDDGRVSRLEPGERASLRRLRDQLLEDPSAAAPDVVDAVRLIDVVLRRGCKAEQERW